MTWRPALRVARRTVRRSLGRSLLVATLVGLPVAGATLLDVLYRTTADNPAVQAERDMLQADAQVDVGSAAPLPADFFPHLDVNVAGAGDGSRNPASVDLAALLPPGSEVVAPPFGTNDVRIARGDGSVRARTTIADLSEPLLAGAVRRVEGRLPERADEVLLSDRLADRLGLAAGDRLTVRDGGSYEVVGTGVAADCLDCETLYATRGSAIGRAAIADGNLWRYPGDANSRLVDLPAGTDVDALWPELAAQGVALLPRELYADPDRYGSLDSGATSVESLQAGALVALVVGLGLLEVVLLAGTAFAVGARRQVRDLGLVAVAGGTARDVRRIVLAQGLVLGSLGAVGGLLVGGALSFAGRPLWERLSGVVIDHYRAGWLELAVAGAVGLLSGVAAAVVPAVGAARLRPVDALMRRFRTTRATRVGVPVVGLTLLVAGAGLALAGSRLMARGFTAYEQQLTTVSQSGTDVSVPTPAGPVALVLGGLTLAVVGLVLTVPTLVSLVGRLGSGLSLSPRLALRDAARHRHRTGPAATAIAIAVAGTVAGGVLLTNLEHGEELRTVPYLPAGVIEVQTGVGPTIVRSTADRSTLEEQAGAAAAVLPGAAVVLSSLAVAPTGPAGDGSSPPREDQTTAARQATFRVQSSADCDPSSGGDACVIGTTDRLVVGGADLLRLVLGRAPEPAELAALASGGAVTTWPQLVADGRASIVVSPPTSFEIEPGVTVERDDAAGDGSALAPPEEVEVAATLAQRDRVYGGLASSVISPDTAARLGLEVVPNHAYVVPADPSAVTADELDRAQDAAEALGAVTYVDPQPDVFRVVRAILLGAGAFVTVVGVAIAVALSAAEGRADLATLAAVGAPPSRRRRLTAAQALLIGLLGCGTGVGLGVFAAYVARATTGSPDFLVPWSSIAVVVVGVPVLAALVAGLVTPSRLPLLRRVE